MCKAIRTNSQRASSAVMMLAAVLMASTLGGCREANPPAAETITPNDTPEAKLEEVMDRLQTGVMDASAAAGSGVVSQRKVSHRLIPPRGEQDLYRAEVTIQTTRALSSAAAAASVPAKKKREEATDLLGEEEEPLDPMLEQKLTEDEAGEAETPTDAGAARRAIEKSRETTTKVYELVYDNERWKLAEEISAEDDEVAKYLFEYALSE